MVYLVDFGTCYKIGVTSNIKSRIKMFRNTREYVEIVNIIMNPTMLLGSKDKELEANLHRACSKYKISNELFNKVEEVKEIFEKYKKDVGDTTDWLQVLKDTKNPTPSRNGRKVFQYSLDGKLIKVWDSVYSTTKEGFNKSAVYAAARGGNNRSGGYIWSFEKLSEEDIKIKMEKARKTSIPSIIEQYNKLGELIKTYPSISEASRATNVSISGISLCCSGKYKTAGGFIWKKAVS